MYQGLHRATDVAAACPGEVCEVHHEVELSCTGAPKGGYPSCIITIQEVGFRQHWHDAQVARIKVR